jgi:hypothetical protein
VRLEADEALTSQGDVTAARPQQSEDRLYQGRLSGPVGADHGCDLALADGDRDAGEDVDLGHVSGDQVVGLEQVPVLAHAEPPR